jgi:hypothetical protein
LQEFHTPIQQHQNLLEGDRAEQPSRRSPSSNTMVENSRLCFNPQEIVCIESGELRLFAEVIQLIPERDRCWAKPLVLARYAEFKLVLLHDLQECSQLILPIDLFRSALDTEVIPVMMDLFQLEKMPDRSANRQSFSSQALHQFIRTLSIESSPSKLKLDIIPENHHHDARS